MIIRRPRAGEDLSGAIALLQRFFREEGFDTPDSVIAKDTQRMAGIEACAIIVAEADGQTVAVATLSLEFGIEYGWSAEMGDLYILPEWRGRGLARRIVSAAEDVLRAKGAAGYQVTVTPFAESHHGLGRFYVALSFSDDGRRLLFKMLAQPITSGSKP